MQNYFTNVDSLQDVYATNRLFYLYKSRIIDWYIYRALSLIYSLKKSGYKTDMTSDSDKQAGYSLLYKKYIHIINFYLQKSSIRLNMNMFYKVRNLLSVIIANITNNERGESLQKYYKQKYIYKDRNRNTARRLASL